MFVWDMNDQVHRSKAMDTVKDGRMKMEEYLVTDEFGEGKKEFLCCAAGFYAPAAVAIIHANSMDEANSLRDEYYSGRIKAANIIFEQLYQIVSKEEERIPE